MPLSGKIIKIPPARWNKDLKEIFETVFDSDLPSPDHAEFYGTYDERGRIETFILVENVRLIGQVYSRSGLEQKTNGQKVRKLVDYIVKLMPDGISVAAVASEKRFEGLFRLLKMQKITGTFFRRNL